MGGTPDLTEVAVNDLLEEVQRRMLCALKPQKRVILIGEHYSSYVMHSVSPNVRCSTPACMFHERSTSVDRTGSSSAERHLRERHRR